MKAITIVFILATYCYYLASGIYLAYPIGRNLCQPSDFRNGIELAPMECTYTTYPDVPNYPSYYSVGTCTEYRLYESKCGTPELCSNPAYCTPFNNTTLR